jgi:DNA-binding response OmpR family regulator
MTTNPEHSYQSESSRSVLLVDDDDRVRQMLSLALRAAGFDVVAAGTQQQADNRLAQIRPDALVLNLQRSEADGLDVLQCMRARQDLSQVPIVFLACCDGDGVRSQAIRAGADWFALRPVALAKLQNRILELIRHGRPPLNLIAAGARPPGARRLKPTG